MNHYICIFILMIAINGGLFIQTGAARDAVADIQTISLDSLLNIDISTAAKYEQKASEASASVTIITSEDIDRHGFRTLSEVFMCVRGFYISDDRNYSYIGVRGFSRPTDYNNRILLLLNGHTLNEDIFGSAYFETVLSLDLNVIERIEIVRGPGSALYGTNAMFAVINIITKKGNIIDGLELSAESGSYGLLRGSTIFGKEFRNGVNLLFSGMWGDIKGADLYYQEFDAPATNNGIAEDLDWDAHYGMFATVSNDHFTVQGYFRNREKGVPTAPWEINFNDNRAKTLDKDGHIEIKYHKQITVNKNIMVRCYSDFFYYKMWYPYDIMYMDESSSNWAGSEFQLRWDTQTNNQLVVGVEYQNHIRAKYRYWDENYSIFEGDFPFTVVSGYLQNEYQLNEKLSLTFGIRYDRYSAISSSTTPRGAIIYSPFRYGVFKLLYGEAFRAPNIFEYYYEEADYQKLNPYLKPEKIKTIELVWEQRLTNKTLGTVSVFNYIMNDLIDPTIDDEDSLWQYQNVSQIRTTGLECELSTRMEGGTHGYINYSFLNAKNSSLNERLSNSPRHIVKMGLLYPILNLLYFQGELLYETERITVHRTKTEPYFLTNINLTTKQFVNHVKVAFKIRNFFDENYKLPGGFEHIQPAIAQNGRNYSIRMEYRF